MKKQILFVCMLLVVSLCVHAQWGKKLGSIVKDAAKSTVEKKAAQKTDQAVDKTIDKATDPGTYKGDGSSQSDSEDNSSKSTNKQSKNNKSVNKSENSNEDSDDASAPEKKENKGADTGWNKFDFVPGDEVIFDDNCLKERVGEFPSQWDLLKGNAEIATVNGQKVICLLDHASITPLMKNMKKYMPEAFTIEMDIYFDAKKEINGYPRLHFLTENNNDAFSIEWWRNNFEHGELQLEYRWNSPTGESRNGNSAKFEIERNQWHHLSFSFNKRAMKVYFDQTRHVNIPNCKQPDKFVYELLGSDKPEFIKNIRIAQGAIPLYDRLMSDGKFITYGITFDVGKSTIKPESMGEINRIAQLMKDNPDVKFSVEGHTDNTGTAATNQTLSDARSKAVVEKLIEMGIEKNHLTSAGKGQNNPIADNSSDEGRAKNRRVEFVKQK